MVGYDNIKPQHISSEDGTEYNCGGILFKIWSGEDFQDLEIAVRLMDKMSVFGEGTILPDVDLVNFPIDDLWALCHKYSSNLRSSSQNQHNSIQEVI